MKKTIVISALLLCFAMLLPMLCACTPTYAVVDQTEEEARVVATAGADSITYDQFRMEFLTVLLAECAKGTKVSSLDEAGKQALFAKCRDAALSACVRLYATFALSREAGIDPYGRDVDAQVSVKRRAAISELGGDDVYRTYLDGLAAVYSGDWLYRLELRELVLREKYAEKVAAKGGELYPEPDELYRYFEGDDTVLAVWMTRNFAENEKSYAEVRADMEALRRRAEEKPTTESRRFFFGGYSTLSDYELENGYFIGRAPTFEVGDEMIRAAFSLGVGEISDVVEYDGAFYVLLRLPKDADAIRDDERYGMLLDRYLDDAVSAKIADMQQKLLSEVRFTAFGESLDFATLTEGVDLP